MRLLQSADFGSLPSRGGTYCPSLGLCGLQFGVSNALAGAMLLTSVLVVLTAIDLDHQLLPDSLTLPLVWIGLLLNIDNTFVSLESAVLGAVFGYLCLWSVFGSSKSSLAKKVWALATLSFSLHWVRGWVWPPFPPSFYYLQWLVPFLVSP